MRSLSKSLVRSKNSISWKAISPSSLTSRHSNAKLPSGLVDRLLQSFTIRRFSLSRRMDFMRRTLKLASIFFAFFLLLACSAKAQWAPLNPVKDFQNGSDGVEFKMESGALKLLV